MPKKGQKILWKNWSTSSPSPDQSLFVFSIKEFLMINFHFYFTIKKVGTGTLQESAKAGLGFQEDGTMDLRSSTEELYFLDGDKDKPVESSDKFTQQVCIWRKWFGFLCGHAVNNSLHFAGTSITDYVQIRWTSSVSAAKSKKRFG